MSEDPAKFRDFPVGWEEHHRHCKALAWRLLPMGPWKGIVAVTRGGLVPAAVIARELDIRVIETISVASYDHQSQGEAQVLKPCSDMVGDGEGWILIDDLVDTGNTGRLLRRTLPKAYFATVYAKPVGKPLVDAYVTEISQDTWIHFPWEADYQFTQPIARFSRS